MDKVLISLVPIYARHEVEFRQSLVHPVEDIKSGLDGLHARDDQGLLLSDSRSLCPALTRARI